MKAPPDTADLVLFTDLDGTLLGDDGLPGPAARALARLAAAGVPVVWCSSKTRLEQEALRRVLGADGPFIVENGSAVLVPGSPPDLPRRSGYGLGLLGVEAVQVRAELGRQRGRLGVSFRGFHELPTAELAAITGLDLEAAERARAREFSETLVGLSDADRSVLEPALAERGLRLACGGRFHTVTGVGADKGAALRWLMARLRRAPGGSGLRSLAVGDSENDLAMLRAADRAYLVARVDGGPVAPEGVERLGGVGPHGFAELVDLLLAGAAGVRR